MADLDFSKQDASKKKTAKAGISHEKSARRRQQQGVRLRQKERDEMMRIRRRGEDYGDDDDDDDPETQLPPEERRLDPWAYTAKHHPDDIPRELLPHLVSLCESDNFESVMQGTLLIRKLLSVNDDPPIDAVIATNIPRKFVDFLGAGDYPRLQFEAAWALTNISSGTPENTSYILNINAAPGLKDLLYSQDADCRDQASWALGNLAGDNFKCRDYILSLDVIPPLLNILSNPNEVENLHKNATWALANMCRGRPPANLEKIAPCIPMFVAILSSPNDELVMDACWGLSYIADGGQDRVQKILAEEPLSRICAMLGSSNSSLVTPSIRILGSVVTGSDAQTQQVIDAGALNSFHFLLTHPKRSVRKEVCWTLSNILAGTKAQIQSVIGANLIPSLTHCMFAAEVEVKKEAVWAVANLTAGSNTEQCSYLVQVKGLDMLCDLIATSPDSRVLAVALEAIDNILGHAEQAQGQDEYNICARDMYKNGGINAVERLQIHNNPHVSVRASTILDRYFECEDEDEMGGDDGNGGSRGYDDLLN